MTYAEFLKNNEIQTASKAFVAVFGGRFCGEESGGHLVYLSKNRDKAYISPMDEQPEILLQILYDSVQNGALSNIIVKRWPELTYSLDCDY